MQARPPKSYLLSLCLILGLSMLVRWDGPSDQAGGIHFWLTAQSLQTFEIWEDQGLWSYGANLVETYPEACNQFQPVPGHTFLVDEAGQYYYTSYPPLGLLLPYALHQLFGMSATVMSLRIWSLLLYALCLYYLFATLWGFQSNYWAVVGTAAFAFSPGPLYYLSHIYFSDMLALFWLIVLLWAIQRQLAGKNMWFWLALLNFCACYTEWLGMLFALVAGIWLSRTQKSSRWFWCFGMSGLLALGLCLWQYSQIAGLAALLDQWLGRLNTQSGADISIWQGLSTGFLLNQFRNYGVILVAIGGILVFLLPIAMRERRTLNPSTAFRQAQSGKENKKLSNSHPEPRRRTFISLLLRRTLNSSVASLLILALLAPKLHQLIFLQFGFLHDFAGLKSGPFWVLLLVCLAPQIQWNRSKQWLAGILMASLLLLYGGYRYHFYVRVSNEDIALGQQIHQHIKTQQEPAVYFIDREPNPILHYYAKHNLSQWHDTLSAQQLIQTVGCEKAVLIHTQNLDKPQYKNLLRP